MEQSIPPQIDEHVETIESRDTMWSQLRDWMRNQLPWWSMSFTVHVVALASLLLLGRFTMSATTHDDIVTFVSPSDATPDYPIADGIQVPLPDEQILPLNPDLTPLERGAKLLDEKVPETQSPGVALSDEPAPIAKGKSVDDWGYNPSVTPGPGAKQKRNGALGTGNFGRPDGTDPWSGRNPADRGRQIGPTHESENAISLAVIWLAHHQSRDGSWSLQDYTKQCKDRTCTGTGAQESISAATAMGVLPFLGAGITHTGKSKYAPIVQHAVYWLVNHQKPDGDLSAGASQQMYSHALATIALCEAYGMTNDKLVGAAAQKGINFIVAAQNPKTGGWRYHPGEDGDTSVTGWQLMALKSGQMAKLNVNPAVFDGVKRWLMAVAKAAPGEGSAGSGQFSYQPEGAATPTMSAVGLLCNQYLRAGRADPVIVGGVKYLMANQPSEQTQNIYYWYYAAQVMHNMNDKDWDKWNRTMRTVLINTQVREGCAAGSWDPDKPVRDAWGPAGGRVMMTSLSALTLEVYYRYLPLYQLDKPQ